MQPMVFPESFDILMPDYCIYGTFWREFAKAFERVKVQ
jgi:hypothetical protein